MRILSLFLAAATATLSVGAQAAALINESAVETSTTLLALPKFAPETLSVRACAGCPAKQLRLTEATELFVGDAPVQLPMLRDLAAKNSTWIYVFYDAQTRQITRIKLDAQLPSATRTTKPAERKQRGK
jgi:hypothetical protein